MRTYTLSVDVDASGDGSTMDIASREGDMSLVRCPALLARVSLFADERGVREFGLGLSLLFMCPSLPTKREGVLLSPDCAEMCRRLCSDKVFLDGLIMPTEQSGASLFGLTRAHLVGSTRGAVHGPLASTAWLPPDCWGVDTSMQAGIVHGLLSSRDACVARAPREGDRRPLFSPHGNMGMDSFWVLPGAYLVGLIG